MKPSKMGNIIKQKSIVIAAIITSCVFFKYKEVRFMTNDGKRKNGKMWSYNMLRWTK